MARRGPTRKGPKGYRAEAGANVRRHRSPSEKYMPAKAAKEYLRNKFRKMGFEVKSVRANVSRGTLSVSLANHPYLNVVRCNWPKLKKGK